MSTVSKIDLINLFAKHDEAVEFAQASQEQLELAEQAQADTAEELHTMIGNTTVTLPDGRVVRVSQRKYKVKNGDGEPVLDENGEPQLRYQYAVRELKPKTAIDLS
jgi:hypothetical protein